MYNAKAIFMLTVLLKVKQGKYASIIHYLMHYWVRDHFRTVRKKYTKMASVINHRSVRDLGPNPVQ